jgi:hypothetical protein
MGKKSLVLCLAVLAFATVAHADPLPVGSYTFSINAEGSGIHSGTDDGTLSGILDFDSASNIISADVIFVDTTIGKTFTFTNPGPVTIETNARLLLATISNATDPGIFYDFYLQIPGRPDGTFNLTCGVDCHNAVIINNGGDPYSVQFNFGPLTPAAVPEPSSFLLLGTGALGTLAALRRRLFQS